MIGPHTQPRHCAVCREPVLRVFGVHTSRAPMARGFGSLGPVALAKPRGAPWHEACAHSQGRIAHRRLSGACGGSGDGCSNVKTQRAACKDTHKACNQKSLTPDPEAPKRSAKHAQQLPTEQLRSSPAPIYHPPPPTFHVSHRPHAPQSKPAVDDRASIYST